MHLLATDRLTCPRCGPEFGLILLAHHTGGERRVLEGELGCANCRDRFPVRGGFGDLRAPPRGELPAGRLGGEGAAPATLPGPADLPEVERLQALLNLARGGGLAALVGAPARWAPPLADRLEELEIFAVDAGTSSWDERPGVSRLVARPGLPVFSRTLRAVALDGGLGHRWIGEGVRTLSRGGRLLVVEAPEETAARLEEAGLEVLAEEAGSVVAARA